MATRRVLELRLRTCRRWARCWPQVAWALVASVLLLPVAGASALEPLLPRYVLTKPDTIGDPASKLTPAAALVAEPVPPGQAAAGAGSGSVWLRYKLPAAWVAAAGRSGAPTLWYVDVPVAGLAERVTPYVVTAAGPQPLGTCGAGVPRGQCPEPLSSTAFRLDPAVSGAGTMLLVHVTGEPALFSRELRLVRAEQFAVDQLQSQFLDVFLIAFYGLVTVLSLVFFTSFRETQMLANAGYFATLGLSTLIQGGYVSMLGGMPAGGAPLLLPCLCLTSACSVLFVALFFDARQHMPWLSHATGAAVLVWTALAAASVAPSWQQGAWYGVAAAAPVTMALVLLLSLQAARLRLKHARYMCGAWLVVTAGGVIGLLTRLGQLPPTMLTLHSEALATAAGAAALFAINLQRLRQTATQAAVALAMQGENRTLRLLTRTLSHDLANAIQVAQSTAYLLGRQITGLLNAGTGQPTTSGALMESGAPPTSGDAGEYRAPGAGLAALLPLVQRLQKAVAMQAEIIHHAKRTFLARGATPVLKTEPVVLAEAVAAAIDLFAEQTSAKQLTVSVGGDAAACLVLAERVTLVSHILGNLLSNAIKFSPAGKAIVINMAAVSPVSVRVDIIDQGIGIPKELLGSLFDETIDVTRSGTMGEPGSGSGMPLIKAFVEALGGRIEVQSGAGMPEGQGTRVAVFLVRVASPSRRGSI